MLNHKKVLILSPHIDDAEFGCGGTMDKLVDLGCEIYYLAFSDCHDSIPKNFKKTILHDELKNSMKNMGIQNYKVLDFKVREFDQERQRILQTMVDVKRDFEPNLVLTPSTKDFHQDHQVITNECIRAFKHCSILGYELPWNCLELSSKTIITISKENLEKKINSLMCYESQLHRIYHNPDYITSLAKTRGLRIDQSYAEAFEMIRLILN